jgi:ribosome-binding factor A
MEDPAGEGALRARRLAAVVRQAVADELSKMSDPSLKNAVVTGVDVGIDLDLATVYYFARGGGDEISAAQAALEKATGRLRQAVAKRLRAKRVPKLRFRLDEGIVRGMTIDDRLAEISRSTGSNVPERDEPGD